MRALVFLTSSSSQTYYTFVAGIILAYHKYIVSSVLVKLLPLLNNLSVEYFAMRNNLFSQNKNVIDVLFSFSGQDQYARPVRLTWQDEDYQLGGVQFWYAENRGKTRVHHYRVSDIHGEYTFELALETENLTWSLDKVKKDGKVSWASGQRLVGIMS